MKKLTKSEIKQFEMEQKQFGTEVALSNIYWLVGSEIMKKAGVKSIKTKD